MMLAPTGRRVMTVGVLSWYNFRPSAVAEFRKAFRQRSQAVADCYGDNPAGGREPQ